MSIHPLVGEPPADGELAPARLFWEHCRNSLGIARLLVHEHRPGALVETACQMAVENACRAGLAQAGLAFDGDVESALARLSAPRHLWDADAATPVGSPLSAAERVVGWVAEYLRSEAPDHSWGY